MSFHIPELLAIRDYLVIVAKEAGEIITSAKPSSADAITKKNSTSNEAQKGNKKKKERYPKVANKKPPDRPSKKPPTSSPRPTKPSRT